MEASFPPPGKQERPADSFDRNAQNAVAPWFRHDQAAQCFLECLSCSEFSARISGPSRAGQAR